MAVKSKLNWVSLRNDLHDAFFGEFLDPLPYGCFAKAYGLAYFGIGLAAIILELLDDQLRDVVERRSLGSSTS
jgi:hypothetical protein